MDKTLTANDKKYIYDLLADEFIQGLKAKYLGKFERKIMARKVLDNIGKSQTWAEVINFLENFSKVYPFHQPAIAVLRARADQGKETQVISKLESYFKSYPKAD